jgi:hypothetical protein
LEAALRARDETINVLQVCQTMDLDRPCTQ